MDFALGCCNPWDFVQAVRNDPPGLTTGATQLLEVERLYKMLAVGSGSGTVPGDRGAVVSCHNIITCDYLLILVIVRAGVSHLVVAWWLRLEHLLQVTDMVHIAVSWAWLSHLKH